MGGGQGETSEPIKRCYKNEMQPKNHLFYHFITVFLSFLDLLLFGYCVYWTAFLMSSCLSPIFFHNLLFNWDISSTFSSILLGFAFLDILFVFVF